MSSTQLTTEGVWDVIDKEIFGVLGMVTANNESRTVGIVYIVKNRKFYIGTNKDAWKARHIAQNSAVSMTIPIAKRVAIMPWLKIPAATITFSGTARLMKIDETPPEVVTAVYRDIATQKEKMADAYMIEVTPQKDFITYGIGMPLMQMRFPDKARGRVPVV